jgi:glycine amidinotransferase
MRSIQLNTTKSSAADTPELNSVQTRCPVNSFNSWDPLEEVIVGRLEGARIPPAHPSVTFNIPPAGARLMRFVAGRRYPRALLSRAQRHLDGFIKLLESEGVRVRQPDVVNWSRVCRTPGWSSPGFCVACPRDGFIVIGDEIIETPMAWRCRYFEANAYRTLFKEYFANGARWTAAPRPELSDELYDPRYTPPAKGEPMRYVITEFEPVFDAADFIRCGRDIFVIRSNVTNASGIEWMRRHLGDAYRLHELECRCRTPMHVDSSFMPLAPGKVLVNPEYMDVAKLPPLFQSWEVIVAPRPDPLPGFIYRFCSMSSAWISLNVLMLDEQRVIVDESQTSMIRTLKQHGFKPLPCAFSDYMPFGGAFHCATLDIRRQGTLQSYF